VRKGFFREGARVTAEVDWNLPQAARCHQHDGFSDYTSRSLAWAEVLKVQTKSIYMVSRRVAVRQTKWHAASFAILSDDPLVPHVTADLGVPHIMRSSSDHDTLGFLLLTGISP
jgi:hypothetical protein